MDVGAITNGLMTAIGGIMGVFGVTTATGQGLLKFVEFGGMILGWIVSLFEKIFEALGVDLNFDIKSIFGDLFGNLFG